LTIGLVRRCAAFFSFCVTFIRISVTFSVLPVLPIITVIGTFFPRTAVVTILTLAPPLRQRPRATPRAGAHLSSLFSVCTHGRAEQIGLLLCLAQFSTEPSQTIAIVGIIVIIITIVIIVVVAIAITNGSYTSVITRNSAAAASHLCLTSRPGRPR
jgi:hypothetical protein